MSFRNNNLQEWREPRWTDRILADGDQLITLDELNTSLRRLQSVRDSLKDKFIIREDEETGHLIDWFMASLIAREHVLLLGPPGVAKNEISTQVFQLLGLEQPNASIKDALSVAIAEDEFDNDWWLRRYKEEGQRTKYFHFQLSRFTQIEELFGPVEIGRLRRGVLARVNFSLLTSPGTYFAFLDEIFKASGSLLNSLLMLLQERAYINWSATMHCPLISVVAASNELPGGLGGGVSVGGFASDDFPTLYAMLDRFTMRLFVPTASAHNEGANTAVSSSDLYKAFKKAVGREAQAMRYGQDRRFAGSDSPVEAACLNDLLLVGRTLFQYLLPRAQRIFEGVDVFEEQFMRIAARLQPLGTSLPENRITWTISPRKLRGAYKVALAHALITHDLANGFPVPLDQSLQSLRVFQHIWDSASERPGLGSGLSKAVRDAIN